MAPAPLLTLSDIALTFGGAPLFTDISLVVHPRQRACLVGRNGSGKSTILKILAGLVEPDTGMRFVKPGASVAYMEQDPDFTGFETLYDFATADLDPSDAFKAEMALEGLKLNGAIDPAKASGGERRRAALARLISAEPDLMLLDEPTNHLDIEAIGWLEEHLSNTRSAFILISHDRAFLKALSRSTFWIDRGVMRSNPTGFDGFEAWRDKVFDEEDQARHKLNRLIKDEARWAVEGISARRKRNMGRVRRLAELRAERSSQIKRAGPAAMAFEAGSKSGRLVAEADGVSLAFGDKKIVSDFSIRIMRGDRVAFVGPNGAGKTSLLKLLTGEIEPDAGKIRLGTNLVQALLDQNRAQLDETQSLWDNLALDPALGVAGSSDQIMVRGTPKHVVGYLKEFLFADAQARGPVSALSGGEKARLLLAKLMARESNLLILDEPTNDLDVETLDLLQEVIDDYSGTVLLVSHDRDFIDRVATTTVHMPGQGRATVYAGGYSDMLSQRGDQPQSAFIPTQPAKKSQPVDKPKSRDGRMSFKQEHRLKALPAEMERLEAEIAKLEAFLSTPDLFATSPEKFDKASKGLVERQTALSAAEEEWLELETLKETLASS